MTGQHQNRRNPLWTMGFTLLIAWVACGVYRKEVPQPSVATAVLKLTADLDVESLCKSAEFLSAAADKLEVDGDLYVLSDEHTGPARLSGKLSARKISSNSSESNPQDSEAIPDSSVASWELTYCTNQRERALSELTALLAILEKRAAATSPDRSVAAVEAQDFAARKQAIERLAHLKSEREATAEELAQVQADPDAAAVDPVQQANLQSRVQGLQAALTENQVRRLRAEEEWKLVAQEFKRGEPLDAIAAKLTAGPIQEAILQIERQRKLSQDLHRVRTAEQRLEAIYGDQHPKLVELRDRFEQLLSELGGWDHVLEADHLSEHLQSTLQHVVELKQQHESDLQTQVELDQGELSAMTEVTSKQTALTAQLEQIDRELELANQAFPSRTGGKRRTALSFPAPELLERHWSSDPVMLLACGTFAGLTMGWLFHQILFSRSTRDESPRGTLASPIPIPSATEMQLDLAQRRALRTNRLQQVYAT